MDPLIAALILRGFRLVALRRTETFRPRLLHPDGSTMYYAAGYWVTGLSWDHWANAEADEIDWSLCKVNNPGDRAAVQRFSGIYL